MGDEKSNITNLDTEPETTSKKDTYTLLYVLIGVVIILWVISWLSIQGFYGWSVDNNRGTFGDMFGAVNALFSGLAFAGLIFTIRLQRKDINIQLDDFRRQTKVLQAQSDEAKRTADQLEQQQNIMNYQLVQSIVNNLIEIKNGMHFSMVIKIDGNQYSNEYGNELAFNQLCSSIASKRHFEFHDNQTKMKDYIRTFFYILQVINDYKISSDQKNILIKTLDLQTTDMELHVIYWWIGIHDQQKLALLKSKGFLERYEQIKQYDFKPFN